MSLKLVGFDDKGEPILEEAERLGDGNWTYIYNPKGKSYWAPKEEKICGSKPKAMNAQGEDLTIDGYISKHGGIYSHADGKTHTSKSSYLEGLKRNNCAIKDW